MSILGGGSLPIGSVPPMPWPSENSDATVVIFTHHEPFQCIQWVLSSKRQEPTLANFCRKWLLWKESRKLAELMGRMENQAGKIKRNQRKAGGTKRPGYCCMAGTYPRSPRTQCCCCCNDYPPFPMSLHPSLSQYSSSLWEYWIAWPQSCVLTLLPGWRMEKSVTCHPPGLTMGNFCRLGRDYRCSGQLKNGHRSLHLFSGMLVFSTLRIDSEAQHSEMFPVRYFVCNSGKLTPGGGKTSYSQAWWVKEPLPIVRASREMSPLHPLVILPEKIETIVFY